MQKIFLTICLQGGLGNQLFQFIVGYILAKKNKINLKINIERLNSSYRQYELDKFPEIHKLNISKIKNYNFFSKIYFYILSKFTKFKKFEKSPFIFNKNLLKKKIVKSFSISGFFQSEKYFINYKKTVLKLLRFGKIKDEFLQEYLDLINNNNSVAIHIRRGDYFNNHKVKNIHGILGEDYYKKSVSYIKKRVKAPLFLIFSDDIDLIRKTLFFFNKEKHIFINTKSSINDLHLMSRCKHFIIANSTFSWWGAWLSKNKHKIVIAPKKWLRAKISTPDIIPESWIKI